MYWISNGFIFRKIDSPIHRLDPRVKLLISIQLFTLAILVSNIYDLLIIFTAITIFATLGKITTKLLRTMIFATMFSLIILGINYLAGYSIFYSIQIFLFAFILRIQLFNNGKEIINRFFIIFAILSHGIKLKVSIIRQNYKYHNKYYIEGGVLHGLHPVHANHKRPLF